MALAQQAILRGARLESGLFTTCLNETLDSNWEPRFPMNGILEGDGDITVTQAQNRNYLLGEGFDRIAQKSNSWSLCLRYQAQAERQYRRAVEEFERLKKLRPELPNEANLGRKPEANTTSSCQSPPNPTAHPTPTEPVGQVCSQPADLPSAAPQPFFPSELAGNGQVQVLTRHREIMEYHR